MLFHLRKMSDKAISKKKKEKKIWKHKYWTWRAYIVKVGKKNEFTEIIYAWNPIEVLFFRLPDSSEFFWEFEWNKSDLRKFSLSLNYSISMLVISYAETIRSAYNTPSKYYFLLFLNAINAQTKVVIPVNIHLVTGWAE